MATIKSYTDVSQSKVLAKILPIESADMSYMSYDNHITLCPYNKMINDGFYEDEVIPCWSLAALLDILPDKTCVYKKTYKDGRVKYQGIAEGVKELILKDNPIDACYELILKLNKLNLL